MRPTQPKKTAKKPRARARSAQKVSKMRLEVLWRPPRTLLMLLAAGVVFSAAGYTALHLGDAATRTETAQVEQQADQQVDQRTLKIMPLGDDLTYGDTAYPNAYRSALWQKLVVQDGLSVDYVGSQRSGNNNLPDKDHEGHPTWRTDQLNAHVAEWLTAYDPDIVLLSGGINDLAQGASGKTVIERLDLLIATTLSTKPDTTLLVASAPSRHMLGSWESQSWDEYNAGISGLVATYRAQGHRIAFVDMAAVSTSDMDDAVVYSRMADAWYAALKPYLEP